MGESTLQQSLKNLTVKELLIALPVETALSAERTFQAEPHLAPFLCMRVRSSKNRPNLGHMQRFYEKIAGKRTIWKTRS